MTLEDYLEQDAKRYPDKLAVICGDEQCTYAELWQRVTARVAELKQPSDFRHQPSEISQIVCLRALPTIDYLVNYFALHRAGYVVAPLERDIPEATFKEIEQQLCQHAVPEGSADILYTTGTTGKSKGVIISHRTIVADAENLIAGQGFSHDTIFVINGPLNHIGSLSKVYPVILLGGTIIIVNGMKDLDAFFNAFGGGGRVYATFLVPASIRILIQFSAHRLAALADRIDFVETGAAAISQADMEALCRLLPHSRLYNTYASTETGIISTYNYNDGRCMAGCLGHTMPHSELFITPEGLQYQLSSARARLTNNRWENIDGGIEPDLVIDLSDNDGMQDYSALYDFATIGAYISNAIQTGIQELPAATVAADGHWFTLDGRRLQGQPTTKGLYIRGGKKMVVK